MFRRFLSVALALVAAFAPTTPSSAAAHPRHAPRLPIFRVDGTHGYKIDVWADPEGEHGTSEVDISIWKGHAQTTYAAPGQVGPNGFGASFRHLGWIDVDYQSGPSRIVKDCHGRRRRSPGGRFTGTFEFHGEEHFTEADYPRLDVRPLSEYAEGCWGAVSGGGKGATLEALSRYGITKVVQNQVDGPVRFIARAENEFGSLKVYRYVEAFGPARDFVWSRQFRSARVTPPAPFDGSASYRASRAHARWRGDLSVDFLGFRGYPLADRPTFVFFGPGVCKVHGPHRGRPSMLCS